MLLGRQFANIWRLPLAARTFGKYLSPTSGARCRMFCCPGLGVGLEPIPKSGGVIFPVPGFVMPGEPAVIWPMQKHPLMGGRLMHIYNISHRPGGGFLKLLPAMAHLQIHRQPKVM